MLFRLFSMQLKFPRGQKIPSDFRREHAQSWHLTNRTLEKMREKKLRIFNFLGGFSGKKFINQSNLSKMQTNILKNGSRQRENSFSSFFLSGIYYGSTKNNIIKKAIPTNNNKVSNNSYQKVFRNIHRKKPVLKSNFNKFSGLQPPALSKRLQHRCFPVNTFFLLNTSGRLLLEGHKILLKSSS